MVVRTIAPKWMDTTEEIAPNFGTVIHITMISYSKSDNTGMFLHQKCLGHFFILNENDHLIVLGWPLWNVITYGRKFTIFHCQESVPG